MHRKVAVQLDFVLYRQRNESIPEGGGDVSYMKMLSIHVGTYIGTIS